MTMVGGFDVHRKQITFDYVDDDGLLHFGEIGRRSPGRQGRPRVTLCANRLRGCLGLCCCGQGFATRTADAVPPY